MKDTADEVASLPDLLYSMRNRLNTAIFQLDSDMDKEIYTTLEDLYYGAQLIVDTYCVKR